MKNKVSELQLYFCPYGTLDLRRACAIGDQVELYEDELFEIITELKESCGMNSYEKIDPVYCILDHILQMARNKICELTKYDFQNDYSAQGSEIHTYGNYMASSYDWSEGAIEELKKIVGPYLNELREDRFCSYFLKELEIGKG